MLTLEETIQLILKNTDHDRKHILQLIEDKRQELGPEVVNDESAAMIVARELGVDLHQLSPRPRMKIADVTEATRNVVLTAKVVRVDPARAFAKPGGGEGKVASILVTDDSGQIRVALWDEMTKAVEEDGLSVGDVIQIRGAYVKKGLKDTPELNLGRFGGISKLTDEEIEELNLTLPTAATSKIGGLQVPAFDLALTFKVQRVLNISTFTRSKDGSEGKVMSVIGADETGSARIVFWDSLVQQMADVKEGEVVRLTGAYTKKGRTDELEIHAGRSSQIQRGLKEKINAVEAKGRASSAQPLGKVSIGELSVSMRDVDIEGKIASIADIREFDKGSTRGRVRSIIVGDETGSTTVTFWNEGVEKVDDMKEGDTIRIRHGYVKEGFRGGVELHTGQRAEIDINPSDLDLDSLDLSQIQRGLKEKSDTVEAGGRTSSAQPLGKVSIGELSVSMTDVDIEGKVASIAEVREFDKGKAKGHVRSIIVGDESGSTRVTFWNEGIEKIEDLKEGDTIRIRHGYVKEGFRGGVELHTGKRAEIDINPLDLNLDSLDISQIQTAPTFKPVRLRIADIDDNMINQSVEILGMIVDVPDSDPFYLACDKPDCKKKVENTDGVYACSIHKTVEKPIPLLLFKLTLDDGSGRTTRVTVFDTLGEKLLKMTAEDVQSALKKSERPLDKMKGDYIVVRGTVKKFRDSIEIAAREASKSNTIDEIRRAREDVRGLLG